MDAYNGKEIKVKDNGDVLIYDEGEGYGRSIEEVIEYEGEGYGRSIEEVIEYEGELATVMKVGNPMWTLIYESKPMPLRFYKVWPGHGDNITHSARVIDIPHDVAFTTEYAATIFGT